MGNEQQGHERAWGPPCHGAGLQRGQAHTCSAFSHATADSADGAGLLCAHGRARRAPGYGATAHGKLCVSAVSSRS